MKACMGGFCGVRAGCQHYNARDRSEPAERLCTPGHDGVRSEFSMPVVVTVRRPEPKKEPEVEITIFDPEARMKRLERQEKRRMYKVRKRAEERPFDHAIVKISPVKTGFKKDAEIVIPAGVVPTQCPSAWASKPLPDPDPVIVKRPGSEDWRKCGRGVF